MKDSFLPAQWHVVNSEKLSVATDASVAHEVASFAAERIGDAVAALTGAFAREPLDCERLRRLTARLQYFIRVSEEAADWTPRASHV